MNKISLWYASLGKEEKAKMIQRGLIVAASICVVIGVGVWKSGVLTSEPAVAAETTQATPDAARLEAAKGARIDGFRSAKFGDLEEAVREAINKDFGKSAGDIKSIESPIQRTKTLIVRVNDLIPETGEAQIAYILGYKSKALIQVNVLWGTAVTPKTTGVTIARTALVLKNYFNNQGYDRKRIIHDRRMKNGVLVFQTTDEDKHLLRMIYIDVPIAKGKDVKVDDKAEKKSAYALTLNYIADPANPDILKIKPGEF